MVQHEIDAFCGEAVRTLQLPSQCCEEVRPAEEQPRVACQAFRESWLAREICPRLIETRMHMVANIIQVLTTLEDSPRERFWLSRGRSGSRSAPATQPTALNKWLLSAYLSGLH
jgi:hypothetical protein